jgi:hypothetical protein
MGARVFWAPLAVVAAHGLVTLAFGHQQRLDPLFHFLGGAAGFQTLSQALTYFPEAVPRAKQHRRVIAVSGVVLAALLWELAEFFSDHLSGSHIQRGPLDTWGDVALGTAGALVAAGVAAVWRRNSGD